MRTLAAPGFPTRIPFDAALAILQQVAALHLTPVESVVLEACVGRILAEDLAGTIDLPPFANSAMDGYALRVADLDDAGLPVAGQVFAGMAAPALPERACMGITTGAMLPAGADTIVPKEAAEMRDGRLHVATRPPIGQFVRHAGEDLAAGQTALQAGCVLTPARIGLAAALGQAQLPVHARPTVAVFTGGDELRRPGERLLPGTLYDSNRAQLMALLTDAGLQPLAMPALPDDAGAIASAMQAATSSFDVVISSGGVSSGEKDLLPAWLQAHGQVHFWKVLMRPGMPVLFGAAGRCLVLALPGNPVSTLATFLTLGRALLDGLQRRREPRARWHARLAAGHAKRHARREFLRGRLAPGDDGVLHVWPDAADGSHRLAAASRADTLLVLPEGEREFMPGESVEIIPL